MFDGLLSSIAGVINTMASKIPGLTGVPWADITSAVTKWGAAVKLWMDTFPFMYDMAIVIGLMIAVHMAKIAWYWINWLLKKIPFLG